MEKLTPLEKAIYQRIHDGQTLLDVQSYLEMKRSEVLQVVDSLVAKGYVMRNRINRVIPLVALPKKEPIQLKSSWSNQPPLRGEYEKVNSEVTPYNYRTLPPDDPRRVHIESLFQPKGGKGA